MMRQKIVRWKFMNFKKRLIGCLIKELEANYQVALAAANRAHTTATDKQNIAENKYDTLGLEAAYLAQGQAQRAVECSAELETVEKLSVVGLTSSNAIVIGTLVTLIEQNEGAISLFLAPVAGGLKFSFDELDIVVITPSSPLGKQLLGKYKDDEFELKSGQHTKNYRIARIC